MSDYTTVTLPKDVKEELAAGMEEGETWHEYLQRLHNETEQVELAEQKKRFSEDNVALVQEAIREVAQDVEGGFSGSGEQLETAEIDYDHVREIVREEVRRALEDVVR